MSMLNVRLKRYLLIVSEIFIIIITLFFSLFVILGGIGFIISSIIVEMRGGGLPYVPSLRKNVDLMIKLAEIKKGQRVIDLGSGDGRLVIGAAKAGAYAKGFELNPFLVWWSSFEIKRQGLQERATTLRKNFWYEDLREADTVFLYGIKKIMPRLEKKLLNELKTGASVITLKSAFPHWLPKIKEDGVRVYERS